MATAIQGVNIKGCFTNMNRKNTLCYTPNICVHTIKLKVRRYMVQSTVLKLYVFPQKKPCSLRASRAALASATPHTAESQVTRVSPFITEMEATTLVSVPFHVLQMNPVCTHLSTGTDSLWSGAHHAARERVPLLAKRPRFVAFSR